MAHNADAGVKKRERLNSRFTKQIRVSENDRHTYDASISLVREKLPANGC